MKIDNTFSSEYLIEAGEDLDMSADIYYFPGASREFGKDGVLVKVSNAQGEHWTGVFAFGTLSPRGVTGVYHLPDESRFCVVAKGTAYIVSAKDPNDWEELSLVPILDVRCSEPHELLVFVNDTEMCAYGRYGQKWRTQRLSWSDLRVSGVSSSEIVAEYWDIRAEQNAEVRVSLKDGRSVGAAEVV